MVKIKEILTEHPDNDNYGYDRIHKVLKLRGIDVSRNTVYRVMKDGGLIHKVCHPSKNGRRKASKNGMNRSLSFVFEIRPHLFHGSLDNEPLPT